MFNFSIHFACIDHYQQHMHAYTYARNWQEAVYKACMHAIYIRTVYCAGVAIAIAIASYVLYTHTYITIAIYS